MDLRHTEESHNRVAGEFLDESLVFGHYLGNISEYTAHDVFDLFRIKSVTHGSVSRQIRKEGRYVLALTLFCGANLLNTYFRFQFLATLTTEFIARKDPGATLTASGQEFFTALRAEFS